jgi:hypothetical protein
MIDALSGSLRRQWAGIAIASVALLVASGAPGMAANAVKKALFAKKAGNAKKVNGFSASAQPSPGKLLALSADGKFPASALPADAVGPRSVVIRFEAFTSDSFGNSGFVNVGCGPGEKATGGGIGWTQSPGGGDAVRYSGPETNSGDTFPNQGSTATGWAGDIHTSDGMGKTGRVYVVCASP